MSYKTINFTPTRLAALRYLRGLSAPVYVCALADQVVKRHAGRRWSHQRATQMGAAVAVPLIQARMVAKVYAESGWGRVSLTDAGRRFIDSIA